MDVGGFARALQYACDARIVVMGKPEEQFFMAAIDDMGLTKDEVKYLFVKEAVLYSNTFFDMDQLLRGCGGSCLWRCNLP